MRWPWEQKAMSIDTVLENMAILTASVSGQSVTPDNVMRSPTMQAIVTAVSRRISVSSLRVFSTTEVEGRLNKTWMRDHPVQVLFDQPNKIQSEVEYWLDSASTLLRWGNFYAEKSGPGRMTGASRVLTPISPDRVSVDEIALKQGDLVYRVTDLDGGQRPVPQNQMHHVRLGSRNYVIGNSPVEDVKEAIAIEIAAEQFGAEFFGNSTMPFLYFKYMEGAAGFADDDAKKKFLASIQNMFGGRNRHKAMLVPKGMEMDALNVDNEKAQFLETRKYQRTVIAGAFGVPPHLVGDLERSTFNNVEQQDKDFVINVILPITRAYESAMERDFLTPQERREGVQIRFNLDEVQRADFRARQEGLYRQRQAGVINANDWREREGMNPRSDEGGDEYWQPANMLDDGPIGEEENGTEVLPVTPTA